MRTLVFLLQKEFRQIFRNKAILPMILVMPVVQLLILPLAADFEIRNIRVSLVDHDRSTSSRALADRIISSGYFTVNDFSDSFDAAFAEFESDDSDLILEIPAGFGRDLVRESRTTLFVAVNAINGTRASVGSAYLASIVRDYNAGIRSEWSGSQAAATLPVVEVAPLNWYNPNLEYPLFMVPGILVVLVTMIGAYMCSLNIVKEKEMGTIEQINVTPIRKHHFILGKLIPFWIIGMVVFSVGLFVVARLIYGIVPVGSLLVLYGFLAVYLVALLGFGLIISNYANTQQQAMSLAFFFMMIFLLMSGLFTPLDSMPDWAKGIARLSPVTYFIEVVRLVVLKGSSFADIAWQFAVVSAMAIVLNAWAVRSYRKTS